MTPTCLYFKCGQCGQTNRVGVAEAMARLAELGMLRRAADAEPAIVFELFAAALDRLPCSTCGATNLRPRRTVPRDRNDAADWPEAKQCVDCGAIISAERLEVLPQTDRCTACQNRDDKGDGQEVDEYCQRCGDRLQLRTGGSGITRYRWFCPSCRR